MKDLISRFWRLKLNEPVRRIGLTFSLLAVSSFCIAGPYTSLDAKIGAISDPKKLVQVVIADAPRDSQLKNWSHEVQRGQTEREKLAIESIRSYIGSRAAAENLATDNSALSQIQTIKRSPFYHKNEATQSANWFGKAANSLGDMISNLFKFQLPSTPGNVSGIPAIFGVGLIYLMWGVLAVCLISLIYVVVRHTKWRMSLRKKASAILEEDEPERTIDEWLERADQLSINGQFREAVRCLYLACLLKFDEANVARFDRGQTNWEHLARIKRSPLLPAGLDFEQTTRSFDQIWYGMRTKGMEDVERFRAWYVHISESLMRKAA